MLKKSELKTLHQEIEILVAEALKFEQHNQNLMEDIHPNHNESGKNLLHYLSLRLHDIRSIQTQLSAIGLSTLAHSESNTLNNLLKIKHLLDLLLKKNSKDEKTESLNEVQSEKILTKNTANIFGKATHKGECKIMVTLPTEAATNELLIKSLIENGMAIARINTAHDNKELWLKMIVHIKKYEKELNKKVKIYMDMEGPKIRTKTLYSSTNNENTVSHLLLYKGDIVHLTPNSTIKNEAEKGVIVLNSPEIFGNVEKNETVWFDDGLIGGIIKKANNELIEVEITNAPDEGFKLKTEKGVTFPQSFLKIDALTTEDKIHLQFISEHADMVGFSFVQTPNDVAMLQHELKVLKNNNLGIILKIENKIAFDNIALLLLEVMKSKNCGLMIARGDLAVSVGYVRMAEVQEELLWLAEAAHLPVIWATQVLETQMKKGFATRAEISDVVKAVRAECVMLNKGSHVIEAMETIKEINKTMLFHENKKRKINRSLSVASFA